MNELMISPFYNDPFSIVYMAFQNLYPDKKCEIYWDPEEIYQKWDSEKNALEEVEPTYGYTDFGDDGTIRIAIKTSVYVHIAIEILVHELAHAAIGIEAEHGELWENAFSAIRKEYERILAEKFVD